MDKINESHDDVQDDTDDVDVWRTLTQGHKGCPESNLDLQKLRRSSADSSLHEMQNLKGSELQNVALVLVSSLHKKLKLSCSHNCNVSSICGERKL